jgi:beta-N-acetylhexosaminidase
MSRLSRLALPLFIAAALAIAPTGIPTVYPAATIERASDTPPRTSAWSKRPSAKALRWAESQLRVMSLEEKVGQLISIPVYGKFLNQDGDTFRELSRQVKENHVGGLILYRGSIYEAVHLTNRLQRLSHYPLLVSADMETGAGMRFDDAVNLPSNMAIGATGNPDYARREGEIIAAEARAIGVRQIFGPAVDVNNNPDNPIINVRSYGEDPATVGTFATAFIQGSQSRGVIATAKHFPGHGDAAVDSHRGLPEINVTKERLENVELVPFRASVASGVGSVMVSFIGLPQIDPTPIKLRPPDETSRPEYVPEGQEIKFEKAFLPAGLSPVVVRGLLRGELRFDGLIVTDALDMGGLTHYFDQEEAAVRSLEAGADMLIKPADPDAAVRGLLGAVRSKRLTEKRIEESARHILAAKYDLGLVQRRETPLDQIDHSLSGPDVIAFAKEVAGRAITLVRNDSKLVPINDPSEAKIFNLAITNGDDRLSIASPFVAEMQRNGTHMETIVLDERSTKEEIQKAITKARAADVVIASLYGRVRAGEARSIGLPELPAGALTDLIDKKVPIISISFGNPYLLKSFPSLQTYVMAYGDMPALQEAAARALLGRENITGRLPISLPGLYQRGAGIQLRADLRKVR